jgi:hypothetical protein
MQTTKVLYSSSKGKESLLKTLEDNTQQYVERIAALKSFRTRTKQKTATRTQIQDWIDEQHDVVNSIDKYEKLRTKQLQVLLLSGIDMSDVQSILQEEDRMNHQRQESRRDYKEELEQLRILLKEQAINLRLNNPLNESDSNHFLVAGVFADVLIQMRSKYSDLLEKLVLEEADLKAEIFSLSKVIYSYQRHDEIESQNTTLSNEILSLFGNSSTEATSNETVDPDLLGALVQDVMKQMSDVDSEILDISRRKQTDIQQLHNNLNLPMDELIPNDDDCSMELLNHGQNKAKHRFYGGWTVNQHETFSKIYRNGELKGIKRSKLFEQLVNSLATLTSWSSLF